MLVPLPIRHWQQRANPGFVGTCSLRTRSKCRSLNATWTYATANHIARSGLHAPQPDSKAPFSANVFSEQADHGILSNQSSFSSGCSSPFWMPPHAKINV
ncbi:hypothetical protein HRR91_000016 [Exophiala dermatitidis]|nr:hypothetical protein HRR91_000016 [Exophiala dermatitidis]